MTRWQWIVLAVAFGPAGLMVAVGGWVFWIVATVKAWRAWRNLAHELIGRMVIANLSHAMATAMEDGAGGKGSEVEA